MIAKILCLALFGFALIQTGSSQGDFSKAINDVAKSTTNVVDGAIKEVVNTLTLGEASGNSNQSVEEKKNEDVGFFQSIINLLLAPFMLIINIIKSIFGGSIELVGGIEGSLNKTTCVNGNCTGTTHSINASL